MPAVRGVDPSSCPWRVVGPFRWIAIAAIRFSCPFFLRRHRGLVYDFSMRGGLVRTHHGQENRLACLSERNLFQGRIRMELQSPVTERRRHPRRRNPSTHVRAIVRTRDSIGEYVIHDLSAGGAFLVGTPLDEKTLVEVVLHDPGGEPIRVMGRVVRSAETGAAVAFVHQGDDAEDGIQTLVLQQLEASAAVHS